MSTIKRYDLKGEIVHQMGSVEHAGTFKPMEDICGEYVLFSDHEAEVEKRNDVIRKMMDSLELFRDCEVGFEQGAFLVDSAKSMVDKLGMKPDA